MTLSKRERHLTDLRNLGQDNNEIISYLLVFSNLPGKRGNLELAFAFAEYIEEHYPSNSDNLLTFCVSMITSNPPNKHVIGNEEFLPFCGIVGLGRIAKIDLITESKVLGYLKRSAQDERWRIREAVAMAIQDLIEVRPEAIIATLQAWIHEDSYLLHRAVVAGVAEPRFVKNREIARLALDLHKTILKKVEHEPDKRDTDYQVLVKGLCYTLSVIIAGIEVEGFAYLETLITTEHPIIRKIVRENLKKKRLTQINAKKVNELQQRLEGTV